MKKFLISKITLSGDYYNQTIQVQGIYGKENTNKTLEKGWLNNIIISPMTISWESS